MDRCIDDDIPTIHSPHQFSLMKKGVCIIDVRKF